jgi:hypothetical protein
MYPPPVILTKLADFSTRVRNPYSELGPLSNITRVSAFAGDRLTMEATLPPIKQSDCEAHFVNIPALPHSVMVFHNCGASYVCFDFRLSNWTELIDCLVIALPCNITDLIGQALSEFTGVDLPFKTQSMGNDHGMRILSWAVRSLSHITWCFLFIQINQSPRSIISHRH